MLRKITTINTLHRYEVRLGLSHGLLLQRDKIR